MIEPRDERLQIMLSVDELKVVMTSGSSSACRAGPPPCANS